MKEQILNVLKQNNKNLTVNEFKDLLNLNSVEEINELNLSLKELENDYQIYKNKKEKYMLFENSHLKKGRFLVNRSGRFGFVDIGGESDIRIHPSNFNNAINNDIVIIELDKIGKEGRILKVVLRETPDLVGEYYIKDNIGYVKLDNKRYNDYLIKEEDSKGAVEGHKVLVRRKDIETNGFFEGEILKIIGHKDDVGVDILSIVYEHGINDVFTEEVMREVEMIPSQVTNNDLDNRRDLRNEKIFTIDGDDAKDFDDAVSIKKLDNGNYLLGVHIADVSHYVKEDTAIGKEAYERGTSVYLVDRVIPMLPHRISNGICSLNELVDRLTITCDMEINNNGNVVKYDIYLSVIHSNKRMTYNNVNKVLEENVIPEGYEDFVNELYTMKDLADILRKNKNNRGYLDFELDEMKIIVDNEGMPIDIIKRYRGVGEKIIEDFMIAANETVATHFHHLDMPLIYRIHEKPEKEKIEKFIVFLNALGYRIKDKKFNAKVMQKTLEILSEREEWQVLGSIALRTMQKAVYSTENVGHYGLGSKYYAHFTSPIRRLPDLFVHREIKGLQLIKGYRNYTFQELSVDAEHSSIREDRAVKCERAVEKYEAAKYMEQHIGEEYEGYISSISRDGIWIQLSSLIEGLVRISEIGKDYYEFDEEIQVMRGRKTGKIYHIGDKVRVVVANASKEEREIDFKIIKLIKGDVVVEKTKKKQ